MSKGPLARGADVVVGPAVAEVVGSVVSSSGVICSGDAGV